MIRWFVLYELLTEFIDGISEFGINLIVIFCMLCVIITVPIWIIPYIIYKKKNEV